MTRFGSLLLTSGITLLVGIAGAHAQSPPDDGAKRLGLDLESADSLAANSQLVEYSNPALVRDYLVPLGAMQKIRGVWAPRDSMRLSAQKTAYTFKMEAGFDAEELYNALVDEFKLLGSTTTFACEARACGSSVQWANRIFRERILYGTEVSQRYAVLKVDQGGQQFLAQIYSSARSSERQYLHLVLLRIYGDEDDEGDNRE